MAASGISARIVSGTDSGTCSTSSISAEISLTANTNDSPGPPFSDQDAIGVRVIDATGATIGDNNGSVIFGSTITDEPWNIQFGQFSPLVRAPAALPFTFQIIDVSTLHDGSGVLVGPVSVSIEFDPVAIGIASCASIPVVSPPDGGSGTLKLVKRTIPATAGDGTFTFTGNGGLGALTIATSGNIGRSVGKILPAGTVTVQESQLEGWQLKSISCDGDTDSGSRVNLAARQVSIDLDAGENITCTFTNERDPDYVRTRTQRVISNFISRRADQITANDPDLSQRLGNNGSGDGSGQAANFSASGDLQNKQVAFSTSLRQIAAAGAAKKEERRAELDQMMSLGAVDTGSSALRRTGFDIWVQGKWVEVESGTAENSLGLLYVGADYKFSTSFLFGVLAQFDWSDEKDDVVVSKVDGHGWLAGPYLAARIHDNAIFDGRLAWGRSENDISPFRTFTDSFETSRWLIQGKLTGDFDYGSWHFAPHVGIVYFEEHQKDYTDSLGIYIPDQTVNLGRITFGPKVSTTVPVTHGLVVSPFVGLKGNWDFDKAEIVDVATGIAAGGDTDLRGRVEGGISAQLGGGVTLTGEGFFDGIGADDFRAYGGSAKMRVPLN